MVRRNLVGPGVSGLGSLGPSVLSWWRIIICGTTEDVASGCVACESLLLSIWNSDHQMSNSAETEVVYWRTSLISVCHCALVVHPFGPIIEKLDEDIEMRPH